MADERGSSCYYGLRARDSHGPEEEDGEFLDEPLDQSCVVEELDKGDEEDDCWNDGDQEPGFGRDVCICEEFDAFFRESEEFSSEFGDEVEDVVAGFCAEDEQGNDELD